MSDFLNDYRKKKFDWKLQIHSEFPLNYIKQKLTEDHQFLFCIEIPWSTLCTWKDFIEKCPSVSYIDLLNASVTDGWFRIKPDCSRIEEILYKNAVVAHSRYKKTKGRGKEELKKKVHKLSVRRNETETQESGQADLENARSEVEEWRKKYDDLTAEKEQLYHEMSQEINKMKEELLDLKNANQELQMYIDTLEKNNNLNNCFAKKHHELGRKQQQRRLTCLKNKAQYALWFSTSFGLDLKEIKLQDQDGKTHTMSYSTNQTEYSKLSDDTKSKIEQVLFLLDKFCVGDEVYHELSLLGEGLPKSYLIKQKRTELNKLNHVERLPGRYPGASISFSNTLRNHIRELITNDPEIKNTKIQVKLSGDGARMSRSTNFMMMSFTLLQLKEKVMSPKHNRTVAVINGPKKYETLKSSLSDFFTEVNNLIEAGKISIDGSDFALEFFVGGDLKFLLLIMGINSAISDFACLYCKVHKDNRWDMSKPQDYYNSDAIKRTIDEIKKLCHLTENKGCLHEPLLNSPLTNVIPDELHLLLRITDRLLQNVIDEAMELDAVDDFSKPRGQPKGLHLSKLIKSINDLGISFSIWNKRNADGSESNIKEFTS